MLEPNYIAIEGVIGVGKSTFARMLSEKIGAELVLDEAMDNPFLVDFYKNQKRYAFSTQIFFLMTRKPAMGYHLLLTVGRHFLIIFVM